MSTYKRFVEMDTLKRIIRGDYQFHQEVSKAMPYLIEIQIDSDTADKALSDIITQDKNN